MYDGSYVLLYIIVMNVASYVQRSTYLGVMFFTIYCSGQAIDWNELDWTSLDLNGLLNSL